MHDLIETYLDRIAGLNSDETHKTFTSTLRQFEQWLNEHDDDI